MQRLVVKTDNKIISAYMRNCTPSLSSARLAATIVRLRLNNTATTIVNNVEHDVGKQMAMHNVAAVRDHLSLDNILAELLECVQFLQHSGVENKAILF